MSELERFGKIWSLTQSMGGYNPVAHSETGWCKKVFLPFYYHFPLHNLDDFTFVSFITSYLNRNWNFSLYMYLSFFRNDDKTAQDYKVSGGSVLHLVLALRGGGWWSRGEMFFHNLINIFLKEVLLLVLPGIRLPRNDGVRQGSVVVHFAKRIHEHYWIDFWLTRFLFTKKIFCYRKMFVVYFETL